MTHRERFIRSILFEPVDRPARMDAFLLTQEAIGEEFPADGEIEKAQGSERERLWGRCATLECRIVEFLNHDAIFAWHPFSGEASCQVISRLRRRVGDEYAIVGLVPNAMWGMEQIHDHEDFAIRMVEDMENLHREARIMLDQAIDMVRSLHRSGADAAYLPNDQAFNSGPYLPPRIYDELVLPYAQKIFAEIRRLGLIGIYHTDGYVMPILDQLIASGAHALQSIDPMAGMDIKEVKKRTYGKLALLGNVQCNLLQEGPEEAIRASARYCLQHASPNSGYVFMASNSVFPGIPLENYLIMQDEYWRFVENPPNRGILKGST